MGKIGESIMSCLVAAIIFGTPTSIITAIIQKGLISNEKKAIPNLEQDIEKITKDYKQNNKDIKNLQSEIDRLYLTAHDIDFFEVKNYLLTKYEFVDDNIKTINGINVIEVIDKDNETKYIDVNTLQEIKISNSMEQDDVKVLSKKLY